MEAGLKRDFSYSVVPTVNYDAVVIDVEYVVIHYTGGSLKRSLELLLDPDKEVSAHLLIAEDGSIIELVPCLDGEALMAWHAGDSTWSDGNRTWDGFNNFSIGIELVNLHGNFFEYTEDQYQSLIQVIDYLKSIYPSLQSADRVVGHEHIAGWRGKADPGCMFEWERVFRECYSGQKAPVRVPVMPEPLKTALAKFLPYEPDGEDESAEFWHAMNYSTEVAIGLANKK